MVWNKLSALLACIILALSLQGCRISYKLNGSALDYTVYHSIAIGQFPIRAALVYPPLQQTFENNLTDYIQRNTRLQTTTGDSGNTDLALEGEITGYSLSPQAVGSDAYATKTRLTISVRVRYTDATNERNNVDQNFSAYRDFDSSELLTDVQDQLCEEISEELVELIFNATLGNW
jgi:hypothetical protein